MVHSHFPTLLDFFKKMVASELNASVLPFQATITDINAALTESPSTQPDFNSLSVMQLLKSQPLMVHCQ